MTATNVKNTAEHFFQNNVSQFFDQKIRFKINLRIAQLGRNICNTGGSHRHVYTQTSHQHAHTR